MYSILSHKRKRDNNIAQNSNVRNIHLVDYFWHPNAPYVIIYIIQYFIEKLNIYHNNASHKMSIFLIFGEMKLQIFICHSSHLNLHFGPFQKFYYRNITNFMIISIQKFYIYKLTDHYCQPLPPVIAWILSFHYILFAFLSNLIIDLRRRRRQ